MIIDRVDNKLITVVPGSNFKFTLYLSYLVIGVTDMGYCLHGYIKTAWSNY